MKQVLTAEQLEKRKKINKKILRFGCLLPSLIFAIIVVIAVNYGGNNSKNVSADIPKKIFDVPSLIGLNIDSIRKILGQPNVLVETIEPSKKEIKTGLKGWTNYFDKGVYELEVRFNPITRNVRNFYISARDTTSHDLDYETVLKICNVKEDNSKYSIEKVTLNNTPFAGIIVMEKTEDHANAAYVIAKEMAKKKLTYPDEANFDWTPTYDKNVGENNYRIVGKVETKNGFGVKKKQTFECVLHYKGGDELEDSSWEVVEDISFD